MKYVTTHEFPPIPDRRWDWSAVTNDYEPGGPVGMGPTEIDALRDLLEQIEESKS